MDNKITFARNLRKNLTKQEQKVWAFLRKKRLKHLKFRRQYPIGPYIVDFICHEKCLIVEIDGNQHGEESNVVYDKERTEYLESKGYKVLRFWNSDVDNHIEAVCQAILNSLE